MGGNRWIPHGCPNVFRKDKLNLKFPLVLRGNTKKHPGRFLGASGNTVYKREEIHTAKARVSPQKEWGGGSLPY